MCGIIGANFKPEADFLELTELLSKRGPDNIATKQIGENYFGHTRLSIMTLIVRQINLFYLMIF